MFPVSRRDHGRHRECGGAVARGKAAPVRQPALILEPRVAKTAVRRDIAGRLASHGLFHHEAGDLRAGEAFGSQQPRVPGVRAVYRRTRHIKGDGRQHFRQRRVPSTQGSGLVGPEARRVVEKRLGVRGQGPPGSPFRAQPPKQVSNACPVQPSPESPRWASGHAGRSWPTAPAR